MKIQNIHNNKRKIYLFCRDDEGKQVIVKDDSFYPYYYELDREGKFETYDFKNVRKVVCSEPSEVGAKRSDSSYESDILFTKRYILDNIKEFNKCPIKYMFIDIEILAKDLPNPEKAEYPISCITIYNSEKKEYKTWYLRDWKNESLMGNDFIKYILNEKPDLLIGWNIENFDLPYLNNRFQYFSRTISPINQVRFSGKNYYPAGISVIDYMLWDKKITLNKRQSYALDNVLKEEFGEGKKYKDVDFSILNEEIKLRNQEDVKSMVELERKNEYIEYFDEIRRSATCLWEDLTTYSKILDMIVLREAKRRRLVLRRKGRKEDSNEELIGAYRRAEVGVFKNLYKADVGSMYPNQIINFCLDSRNIRPIKQKNYDIITINDIHFKQDQNALLPYLSKNLIDQKNILKEELKKLKDGTKEYKLLKNKYDAIKSFVNSLYGVMAFPSFRLFDNTIASTVTYLSRELLKYCEKEMLKLNYKVRYTDTDALMYESEKEETDLLNNLILDWSIINYNKDDINIQFEGECKFKKILVLGKCHYYGIKENDKPEVKGIEMKRSSSSKYEAEFQEELIKKILSGATKEQITDWIKKEKERMKTLPLLDVAFPCKVANREYKNEPIFVRAYNNTKKLVKTFNLNKGELFHYVFVKNMGIDDNGKIINVLAITEKIIDEKLRQHVDWEEVTRRNIISKTSKIFDALKWEDIILLLSGQTTLF